MTALLLYASTASAQTAHTLSPDAIEFAGSILGVSSGIPCGDGTKTWTQWQLIPQQATSGALSTGFAPTLPTSPSALPERYLEAAGLDGGQVTVFGLRPEDTYNNIEFTGMVTWNAKASRQFHSATGLAPWTSKNPLFQLRVQKVAGKWQVNDAAPAWIARAPAACTDLQQLAKDADAARQARAAAQLREQQRRHEENLRKYPVQPHTPDPYYRRE